MLRCASTYCNRPAEDEYHFSQYVPALGREIECVWMLCEECCEFAVSVVECISNLEEAVEEEIGDG